MLKSLLIWDREFCATWPGFLRVIWRFKLTAISSFFASYFVDLKSLGIIAVIAAWIDGYLWVKHQIAYNPTAKGSMLLVFRGDLMIKANQEVEKNNRLVLGKLKTYVISYAIFFFIILPVILLISLIIANISPSFAIESNKYLDYNLFSIVNYYSKELVRVGYGDDVPIQRLIHTVAIYGVVLSWLTIWSLKAYFSQFCKHSLNNLVRSGYCLKDAMKISMGTYFFSMLTCLAFMCVGLFLEPDLSKPSRYNIAGNDFALFLLTMSIMFFSIALMLSIMAMCFSWLSYNYLKRGGK